MRKTAYFSLQNYKCTASVTDMIRELGWVTRKKSDEEQTNTNM